MVVASITDIKKRDFEYSKNLTIAFEYLNKLGVDGLLNLEEGKHIIKDDGEVYLNRSSYVGKEFADAKIEGHNKWLDIQLVLKGEEDFGYVDKRHLDDLHITKAYDEVKDKVNYEGDLDGTIRLKSGFFALVFPNDLHKPCIKVNDEVIEKVVVKVKIDF